MSDPSFASVLRDLSPEQPVLIAGPTASGKSALALEIATTQGGIIVNADASQIYACWRVITARPSEREESLAPHALYGHIGARDVYSTGHWLREVAALLHGTQRPIIVGGTGLYFKALTQGLADIPATPPDVRARANNMQLDDLLTALDSQTRAQIDTNNRARVQRAWEVLQSTGRGLAAWQAKTPPPLLPLSQSFPVVFDVEKEWLNARIVTRFDRMLEDGALSEIAAQHPHYDPDLPAHRAIGVPELMAYYAGEITLDAARERAIIATRRYAKRQRTWLRNKMDDWRSVMPP